MNEPITKERTLYECLTHLLQEHRAQAVFNHSDDYVMFPDEATTSLCCWDSRNASRKQLLSLGQMIDRPDTACLASLERPGVEEECNTAQCKYVSNPKIKAKETQRFLQSDPAQTAVKLKVGGEATVYEGTTVKISCPVRHYDKSKITWAHGSILFHSGKRRSRHSKISVSSKGCVKIKKIAQYDEGVYTCMGES